MMTDSLCTEDNTRLRCIRADWIILRWFFTIVFYREVLTRTPPACIIHGSMFCRSQFLAVQSFPAFQPTTESSSGIRLWKLQRLSKSTHAAGAAEVFFQIWGTFAAAEMHEDDFELAWKLQREEQVFFVHDVRPKMTSVHHGIQTIDWIFVCELAASFPARAGKTAEPQRSRTSTSRRRQR